MQSRGRSAEAQAATPPPQPRAAVAEHAGAAESDQREAVAAPAAGALTGTATGVGTTAGVLVDYVVLPLNYGLVIALGMSAGRLLYLVLPGAAEGIAEGCRRLWAAMVGSSPSWLARRD